MVVFQPQAGTAPYLGSVADYTSYFNPPDPPFSTNFLDLFISPLSAIPARKSMPPRPVCPSLKTSRHDPRLWHTRAASVSQFVIQEHLNNIYHTVTDQRETYDKLKLQHPKRWITSMYNELGRLASGVGDRIPSRIETIFKSIRIKSQQ